MNRRYSLCIFASFSAILLLGRCSESAPAFTFKKSFGAFNQQERYPSRAERRLVPSPIHFITPFMLPQPEFSFFGQQASVGSPASSSIYKLPLRLFSNGKPHAIFHGIPKQQNVLEYLPNAMSNVIRLPLKYVSNAKPVGLYFKDPSFNYL